MEFQSPHRATVIAFAASLACLNFAACDRKASDLATDAPSKTSHQVAKPQFNQAKTKLLSDSEAKREVGPSGGKVQLLPEGLAVAPGTSPTSIEFEIEGKFPAEKLVAWMSVLPPDVLSLKDAATSRLTVYCDGELIASVPLDRLTNLTPGISLSNVSTLKVVVDNGGNGNNWDAVFLGIQ